MIAFKQATIDKITHEMAVLKRLKFAAKSEHFNPEQESLLEVAIDTDLEALQRELEQLSPVTPAEREKRTPKRENLPRHEIRHEPSNGRSATSRPRLRAPTTRSGFASTLTASWRRCLPIQPPVQPESPPRTHGARCRHCSAVQLSSRSGAPAG